MDQHQLPIYPPRPTFRQLPTRFKVYLNHEFARLPVKAHPNDAGYDIHSCVHDRVLAKQWKGIRTGVQFDIPVGWEIQVRPRSGLALKKGITVLNTPGTIDEGFTGEIIIIVYNAGEYPFDVAPGDRLAQLVMQPVYDTELIEIEEEPTKDVRGNNGFGSTGIGCNL